MKLQKLKDRLISVGMKNPADKKKNSLVLLNTIPKILFDHNKKIVLMWSAKAGCTFVCKWFFAQMNLLDAALYYNKWVHLFRDEVYYRSESYIKNLPDVLNGEFKVIKVVRNPFARAVSSYITGLAQAVNRDADPAHERVKKELEAFLKRSLGENESFSFREYVDYLTSIDILKCDIHHRQQLHPLESEGLLIPSYIVDLEECEETLKKIEIELNLQKTDLSLLRKSPHHTKRESRAEFCGDRKFKWMPQPRLPDYRSFYDKKLIKTITDVYKMDFAAYGYNHEDF